MTSEWKDAYRNPGTPWKQNKHKTTCLFHYVITGETATLCLLKRWKIAEGLGQHEWIGVKSPSLQRLLSRMGFVATNNNVPVNSWISARSAPEIMEVTFIWRMTSKWWGISRKSVYKLQKQQQQHQQEQQKHSLDGVMWGLSAHYEITWTWSAWSTTASACLYLYWERMLASLAHTDSSQPHNIFIISHI